MSIKTIGKNILCSLLESQVKRLLKKNQVTIIAVGGSVGKTSTKLAIAKTLESWTKVIYQDGNYNDRLTVPLVLFDRTEPSIFNVIAWVRILLANEQTIKNTYPYKYAVLEFGPDGPGQIKAFSYLNPDLYVLTAIADEHMEYFVTLDKVAEEELTPIKFSKRSLINLDNVDSKYLGGLEYLSYAGHHQADYTVSRKDKVLNVTLKDIAQPVQFETDLLGEQGAMVLLAAASVNHILGRSGRDIKQALGKVKPVAGRMQLLKGINDSLIIDDTYNASPIAVKAALDVLYSLKASKRIAVLGSMNELGPVSVKEHINVGNYCDPKKLALVVTIGAEAKKHLAPAAKSNGCQVVSFLSPYEAGLYIKSLVEKDTAILVKGSQNRVFSEEAVKQILSNPNDASKLVRQSKHWMNIKNKQFS